MIDLTPEKAGYMRMLELIVNEFNSSGKNLKDLKLIIDLRYFIRQYCLNH